MTRSQLILSRALLHTAMCTHTQTHRHTHTQTQIQTDTHKHTDTDTNRHTQTQRHTYTDTHTDTTQRHTCTQIQTHTADTHTYTQAHKQTQTNTDTHTQTFQTSLASPCFVFYIVLEATKSSQAWLLARAHRRNHWAYSAVQQILSAAQKAGFLGSNPRGRKSKCSGGC